MSKKASGNDEENHEIEEANSGVEGEKLPLDPDFADQLDPVDHWWDDSPKEEEKPSLNRKLEPFEERTAKRNPKPVPVKRSVEQEQEQEQGGEKKKKSLKMPVVVPPESGGEKEPEGTPKVEAAKETKGGAAPEESVAKSDTFLVDPSAREEEIESSKDSTDDEDIEPAGEIVEGVEAVDEADEADEADDADDADDADEADEADDADDADEADEADDEKTESEEDEVLPTADAVQAPVKQKKGCWAVFTTLFFIASILLLIALGIGAAFLRSKLGNLEEEISVLVAEKLESQGVYYDYEGWRYQFPRGLILEDITLFEAENRENPKLKISDIGVNVDFLGLIRDRTASSVELSFDESSLTFFHEGQEIGTMDETEGEVFASQKAIRIERFDTLVGGLRLALSGEILLPQDDESAVPAAEVEEAGAKESMLPYFSMLKEVQPWLAFVSEGEAPIMDVQLAFDSADPDAMELSARLDGQNFKWRDVPVASVSAAAKFDPVTKEVEVGTFQLGHGDGFIGGVLSVDTEAKLLTLVRVQSTVDLIAFLSELDPDMEEKMANLRFLDSPTIQLSGTVPFESPAEGARLKAVYVHRGGIGYTTGERELVISDLRGQLDFSRGALETNEFAARVLGGDITINGATRITADEKPFSGLIEISRLSLEEVAAYYGKPDLGLSGDLFLDFRGVGYSQLEKIRGGGNLRINDAQLASFPAIGEVQKFLGKVIPAFGIKGEGSVTGAYLIESGILVTNDLTVEQAGAKLVTNGSVKLKYLTTDFTTTASLQPTLAAATGLEDKTITIVGEGDLMKPDLMLKDFPLDFASGALSEVLGTSPETLANLQKSISDEAGAAAKVFGSELEEATGLELGEEVSGLLEGLFKGKPEEGDEAEAPRAAPITAEPVPEGEN